MKSKADDKAIKRLGIFAIVSVAVFILTVMGAFGYFFGMFEGKREVIEIPEYVGKKYSDVVASGKLILERELVYS